MRMRIGKYEITCKWNYKWSPWERVGFYIGFFLIGVGIVEMAIAAVIIYADPEHAIQNIQRTYFSKNGLPDEKEASIYAKNGVANFSGAFIQYNDPKNGKMGKNPDAHSLII